MPKIEGCPYGADSCPKVEELEERVARMEANQNKIMKVLYYIMGIVTVSLGITGGSVIF